MLDDASASYRRALWHDQRVEVMVFTEKDAISGVLYPVTSKWDVPLGVIRGYASETFAYTVAEEILSTGKLVFVYQFGDHDPSGVDAWRDFQAKVGAFVDAKQGYPNMLFERLAVTTPQIVTLDLPTRPTKKSDSRARDFAGGSVEVDAIPPSILREIADEAITQHIDAHDLEVTRLSERSERELLTRIANAVAGDNDEATS